MYTPQSGNYKNYARNRIWEIIAYNKIDVDICNEEKQTWKGFAAIVRKKNVLVVVSEKHPSSYHVLNAFFPKISKYCHGIAAVVQLSEDVLEKEVRGYIVGTPKDIEALDRDIPCLLIALEDYDENAGKLYSLGFRHVYSFYNMECGNKGEWYKKFLRFRLYRKKSSIVLAYMNKKHKITPSGTWSDFKRRVPGRRVFAFGSGNAFREFYRKYGQVYRVEGIIDNAKSKEGTKLFGIPVHTPATLTKYSPENVIILITTIYFEEIYKQLKQMGYEDCYVYPHMESLKLEYRVLELKKQLLPPKEICLFYLYRLFPIHKRKITVLRHYGKGYGCHSKYIVDEIIKEQLDYKIVWLVNDIYEVMPRNVIKVENTLKNRVYHLATAHIWLDNDMKVLNTRKKKGQVYINTWHGTGISLKKFYLDDPYTVNPTIIRMTHLNAEMADIYLAGSLYIAEVYHSAFAYKGRIEITGSPRVDILINGNSTVEETVRKRLGLKEGQKLLLYAPTMRTDASGAFLEQKNLFQLDFERICNVLHEKWGGEWITAVRLHPRMPDIPSNVWKEHHLLNLTSYQDVQELLLIAEILVTDYSSIMFDMGYAGKKVFLYTGDREDYKNQKELLFPVEKLPFPQGRTQEEVEDEMMRFDEKLYEEKLQKFHSQFGILEDGKASQRVVALIKEYVV